MWLELRGAPRRRGPGYNAIVRFGSRRHLDARWAWKLGWEQYNHWPFWRAWRTRDGWLLYVDAGHFHVRAQWHYWRYERHAATGRA